MGSEMCIRDSHEVVDLAGPDPEGSHPNPEISIARNNKWSDIGVKRAVGHMRYSETVLDSDGRRFRSLFLQARPGHPLCEECKRVIEVVVKERGHLSARCDPCGWSRNYRAHGKSTHHAKGFLGALADDQRADQQSAKMTAAQHGAPVAIVCPSCAAPLSLEAKDRFVTCEFCHTSAKIPSNLRSQVFAEDVAPEPFWLLFKGPSAARKKIVKQLVARKNKAAKQAKVRQAEKERKLRVLQKRKKAEADQRLKRVASVVVAIVVCAIYFFLWLRSI